MPRTATAASEKQRASRDESSEDSNETDNSPKPLQRSSTVHSSAHQHRPRHSKKLSLNFPIFVPSPQEPLPSAGVHSPYSYSTSVHSPYRNGMPISAFPIPSPEAIEESAVADGGTRLLELIAAQERIVMEMKEEYLKAESHLLGLKRQWANLEAKRKHAELKTKTVKLGPVSPRTASSAAEDEEARRVRRKEERERKMRELGMADGELNGNANSATLKNGRNGGRVFAGRHTRTLSLLQNSSGGGEVAQNGNRPRSNPESGPSTLPGDSNTSTPTSAEHPEDVLLKTHTHRPSLSRQLTLPELIASGATGAAQLNFGKTYKDIASASRKSLPPGADVFVKQGKQVYDGVSQGFWSFVEDIRQATVGDEATNMTPQPQQRKEVKKIKSNKKLSAYNDRNGEGKRRGKNSDSTKSEKDNFWKEFGLETPKNAEHANTNGAVEPVHTGKTTTNHRRNKSTAARDHESKLSTDSKCPPSLLADLADVNENDEAWDNWPTDSPVARRHAEQRVKVRNGSESGGSDRSDTSSIENAYSGRVFTGKGNRGRLEASWAELTS